ncbi:MAG TPA: Ig-like domain-containing protein [Thermoanaerobaculia bacterium]|nr:Ig-like domain-containing protein [Thermoanaerobaculia bacterium]
MRRKVFLVSLLICFAVLGSSRPGLADSSSPIPADLLDHLLKQGWTEVSPGVMQRSLGGNRVETLGFGAAGLRFELQVMKAHLADLREDYARQPSRQLRITIRAHRAQILRVEEALRKARSADGLEVSAESLIDPGSNCSATYDAAAIAYPLAQGAGAKAAAHFNSACSEIGEVYAHSKSSAITEDGSDILSTRSDPALNTPRIGSNVSASAATSVPGVTNCHSYAYASVLSYDTGITYSQDDDNYSCVASLPSPWTKSDVGTVGLTGNASYDSGVFKLLAGGTDLAGTADAFHFVHRTLSGDGTIVANVAALLKPGGATRTLGGVTFRNDLTAGSAHATMTITSEGEAQFRRRATAGGTTASASAPTTFAPQWLKLVRAGNTFTAYLSANGSTWTQVSTQQTVTMSNTVYVGLVALRNGSSAPTGVAQFENVAVTTPPNGIPVAVADTASTKQGVPVTISVLANDSDPNGDPLTVTSVTQPANGSVAIQPGGGAVVYTPGTPPSASFQYTVSDGRGGTATATVSVTIIPNTAPDARGDQIRVSYNTPLTIQHSTLLSNDFDADGDTRTITGFNSAGIVGTLSCPAGGTSCTYTPPAGYRWVTSYTYTVSDGRGGTDTATVKLKVGIIQSEPVAVDDFFTTTRNTTKNFTIYDILANDSDLDGDVLNPVISSTLDYGSVSCTSPIYNCAYTPNAGFIGNDRFYYGVSDTTDGSASAYIQMTVLPPAVPVLDAREDQKVTSVNRAVSIDLLLNDYDPEGDPLTVTSTDSTGLAGSLSCNTSSCTYTPSTNYTGMAKFRYTVSDGHGNSDTAIVRIRVGSGNTAPISNNDALLTKVNTPVRFSIFELMKNDYDPDNDPLNVSVYANALHGTVSCSYPQYWCTYTPAANFTGTDSFAYALGDGITYASGSMVNVTVTP